MELTSVLTCTLLLFEFKSRLHDGKGTDHLKPINNRFKSENTLTLVIALLLVL